MNKKKLVCIVIIIISIILIIVGVAIPKKNKKESKKEKDGSLYDFAGELYENKSYLELPKAENGMYYMTVDEYIKKGYNKKLVDSSCQGDDEIIYFSATSDNVSETNAYYVVSSCNDIVDELDPKTSLLGVAKEIYLDNLYVNLPKNNEGVYYLTLETYKKMGYNSALIDNKCPDDFAIIYFDIENKDKYELYPYYIMNNCKENGDDYNDITKSLHAVAKDLYISNKYLELPKNEAGIYYMTVEEYKNRGYNHELIDTTCPNDFAIINFDINNKDEYELYPYYLYEKCQ